MVLADNAHAIFTARVRSTTGGYVFTGVCLFRWGIPSPRFFPRCLVPDPFPGDTQPLVPCPFWGYPSLWSHVLSEGGTPVPPPAKTGLGYPPPFPGLVMPRVVCLVRFPAGRLSCCRKGSSGCHLWLELFTDFYLQINPPFVIASNLM